MRWGYNRDKETLPQINLLMLTAEEKDISEGSITEKECLEHLINQRFCVESEDGRVQVAALTIRNRASEIIMEYLADLPEYRQLKEEMHGYIPWYLSQVSCGKRYKTGM